MGQANSRLAKQLLGGLLGGPGKKSVAETLDPCAHRLGLGPLDVPASPAPPRVEHEPHTERSSGNTSQKYVRPGLFAFRDVLPIRVCV